MFKATQPVTALRSAFNAEIERTKFKVPALADTGKHARWLITAPLPASVTQGDFMVLTEKGGDDLAVWLDKDGNGAVPNGTLFVAKDEAVKAYVVTGMTRAQVAAAMVLAIASAASVTDFIVTDNHDGTFLVEAGTLGTVTAPVLKDEAETGAGSITSVTTQVGATSALQSKYILFSSTTVDYYAWLSLDGAGVDPSVASRTGIAVTAAGNCTPEALALAFATAIEAHASFLSDAAGSVFYVKNNTLTGNVLNATAGNSTFECDIIQGGHAAYSEQLATTNPGTLAQEPAVISEQT